MSEEQSKLPASFSLRLLPRGCELALPADQTVLQSAELAGWRLPSSCRNGSCRTCLSRLQSGSVQYRIEWPGVLREEQQQGWILPCIAYPHSDLVLEAPAARPLFDEDSSQ